MMTSEVFRSRTPLTNRIFLPLWYYYQHSPFRTSCQCFLFGFNQGLTDSSPGTGDYPWLAIPTSDTLESNVLAGSYTYYVSSNISCTNDENWHMGWDEFSPSTMKATPCAWFGFPGVGECRVVKKLRSSALFFCAFEFFWRELVCFAHRRFSFIIFFNRSVAFQKFCGPAGASTIPFQFNPNE